MTYMAPGANEPNPLPPPLSSHGTISKDRRQHYLVLKFNITREGPKTIKYTRDTNLTISSRENKTRPANAESPNFA